jgi:glycosyltransferase involved in cell wall biosynthesis
MAEAGAPPAVAVWVGMLTFRRPDRLGIGLGEVIAQVEDLAAATGRPGHVLVVDNDPEASARDYVSGLAATHPVVRYVHEPTPGIAAARQRCLEEAADADLLAFIDDDEIPEAGWLANLVAAWERYDRPGAVAGAIRPRYLSAPPAFVEAGGFFVRAEYPDGTPVPAAPTSNLLVDLAQVHRFGLGFETRLGLRGGEDTLFTRQLVAAGGRIVFCSDAPVHDLVPDDRNTREWVLRRAWHMGNTHSFITLWLTRGRVRRLAVRVGLAAGGLVRAVVGGAQAVAGRAAGSLSREAKGLRMHWRGRGRIRGAVAPAPPEYQR